MREYLKAYIRALETFRLDYNSTYILAPFNILDALSTWRPGSDQGAGPLPQLLENTSRNRRLVCKI